jgi:hypothetical protein
MKLHGDHRRRLFALALALLPMAGHAYNLSGRRWNSAATTMHLQLGSGSGTLLDGSASWGQVAENALATWNTNLASFRFQVIRDSTAARARGNGINNVFFSTTIYGNAFDSRTLAVTLSSSNPANGHYAETDVIFNSNLAWNSYRGAQRSTAGGTLYDFWRVALHEFGHALGLNHPDDIGQSVSAIMHSTAGNLDQLTSDDIAGARAIYDAGLLLPPSITAQPVGRSVPLGVSVSFSVTAVGSPPLAYQWREDGTAILGATLSTLTRTALRSATYTCAVSNAAGTVVSQAAGLTVLDVLGVRPVFTEHPLSARVPVGFNAGFTVTATGTPAPTYQWKKNGASMAGQTNRTLVLTNVQLGDAATYTCDANNPAGSATSNSASLTVIDQPALSATVTLPPNSPPDRFALPPGAIRPAQGGNASLLGVAAKDSTEVVAVGAGGMILRYRKNEGWRAQVSPTVQALRGLAYGNLRYVTVGDAGFIASSPDGANWTRLGIGVATEALRAVAYSAALRLFVAVGDNGAVLSSLDGGPWFRRSAGTANYLSVSVGAAGFTAVGFAAIGGTQQGVLATSSDGVTWTSPQQISRGPALAVSGNDLLYAQDSADYPGSVQTRDAQRIWREADAKLGRRDILAFASTPHGIVGAGTDGLVTLRSPQSGVWSLQATEAGDLHAITDLPPEPGVNPQRTAAFWIAVGENGLIAAGTVVPAASARLANLSVRSAAGTGDRTLIAGFVVGNGAKPLLARGVGPSLPQFGITGALPDPELSLYAGGGALLAGNNNWGAAANAPEISATAAALGAFSLAPTSRDAALLVTPNNGPHTVQVTGGGATGIALIELYDAEVTGPARLINMSARAHVGTGSAILIAGFAINGTGTKSLLLRGVGPTLRRFGVTGALSDPLIAVYSGSTLVASNDDWSSGANTAQLRATATTVGAFALEEGGYDAALLVTLPPGPYTAQVSGFALGTGVGLVEIYEVP